MLISILAKVFIFPNPLYFQLKIGCHWWRQLMVSKRSRKQRCRDLICFLFQGLYWICQSANGLLFRGGHERWLLQRQMSLIFTNTWIHASLQPEWVDGGGLTESWAHTDRMVFVAYRRQKAVQLHTDWCFLQGECLLVWIGPFKYKDRMCRHPLIYCMWWNTPQTADKQAETAPRPTHSHTAWIWDMDSHTATNSVK